MPMQLKSAPPLLLAAVIAVFVAGCRPVFGPHEDAGLKATEAVLSETVRGAQQYIKDGGTIPPEADNITYLIESQGRDGWSGPYVQHLGSDAWGTAVRARVENQSIQALSAGPDMAFGTQDDMQSVGPLPGM